MSKVSKEQIENGQVLDPQILEPTETELKLKAEEVQYVCPLTVNYIELEKLLNGKTIAEYVGKNLPENEVKRIEEDFKIYQSIKK